MPDRTSPSNVDSRALRVLSVCAGGGGLDAGLKLAVPTARTVCYLENEITEAGVLVKGIANAYLDDAPIWTDLKTFDYAPWRGLVDCVIGGYPCQPFSQAGLRRGVADERHLWPYIARIIRELAPYICFFENVEGHLTNGYYNVVKPHLEGLGYRVTEGLFTAAEVGAPQQRKRLYILAIKLADSRDKARPAERNGKREKSGEESRSASRSNSIEAMADPSRGLRGAGLPRAKENAQVGRRVAGQRRESMGDSNITRRQRRFRVGDGGYELPTWPPGPTSAPSEWYDYLKRGGTFPVIRRGADGLAYRTDRLHVLGNGVIPDVAAKAFVYLAGELLRNA